MNPLDFDPANVLTPRPAAFVSRDRFGFLAACMMHVEGYYSIKSAAFKNRNPGNLRAPGDTTGFRQFGSPISGYVALVNDIQANAGKTLRSFVNKYAPPSENNTSDYLQIVSTLTGIGPDEAI